MVSRPVMASPLGRKCRLRLGILFLVVALLAPAAVPGAGQPQPDESGPTSIGSVEPVLASLQPAATESDKPPPAAAPASPFGPYRTSPDAGVPRHAYSPFDEKPEEQPPLLPGRDFVPGQVLVKLAPPTLVTGPQAQAAWTSEASLNDLLSAQGVTQLEPVFPQAQQQRARAAAAGSEPQPSDPSAGSGQALARWYRASLPAEADVPAVAQAVAAHPDVEAAEPDYLRRLADLPGPSTDPLYSSQWHLAAIKAPEAWQFLESQGINPGGSHDVVVAVIDTGVDYSHPDLAGNIWTNTGEIPGNNVDDDQNGFVDDIRGANVVSTLKTGDPQDDNGHGTHVAGIVAAQANNGVGGVGVAYNVQVMPIKAAQYSGVLSASDIAEAIYYAVDKGADIINMSFGGYTRSQLEEDALAVAFGQAVLVAAAGNDAQPTEKFGPNIPWRPMYPAAYNWVLGVMASTQGGGLASFSNYDPFAQTSYEYELMAPGVDILSTLPNGQYAAWDGTSMAAPVVSGMAALVRSYFWDKDVYSSRFIMGQVATTGPLVQAYTPYGQPPVFYRVPDVYAALTTFPKPKLSYLQHWLFDTPEISSVNDGDGIVDAGETIDLAIVVRNHWGKADNVEVNLRAYAQGAVQDDPYITFATGTVNYGAIGSFNWDDNGLIYDAQGVITGVSHPFRFTVSADTPNDHVIPFLLTMTAVNGLDPGDTATYTFQSRFNLVVQRGKELPRIISQNMTLTKDYFWIVPGEVFINPGVTLTITAGTQVQWGSPKPVAPYSELQAPYVFIGDDAALMVQGSYEEPVELFPKTIDETSSFYRFVWIGKYPNGQFHVQYAKVLRPSWGTSSYYYGQAYQGPNSIDHSYLSLDRGFPAITGFIVHGTPGSTTNSIIETFYDLFPGYVDTNLFHAKLGSHYLIFSYSVVKNSVFLQNNQKNRRWQAGWYGAGSASDNFSSESEAAAGSQDINNAFLSKYWDPDINHWMRAEAPAGTGYIGLAHNYWGTTSTTLIDTAIRDWNDSLRLAHVVYQPILTTPAETTYPFVVNVIISQGGNQTQVVGPGEATFTVTFNRDMATAVQPQVSFGPDTPVTDYTVHAIGGGWQDPRTWAGTFNINPITGDGYQLMRIAGPARAASDPWLVIGDDAGRFRFEIITSGTEAMNLQASGVEGAVELMWTQDDFDLLAGYNLYRSTSADGSYTRLNSTVIPAQQKSYRDTNVQPGQPYYYKFTVVKTDMTESSFSNVAAGTPLDTIAPVISHSPVASAAVGLPLSIWADVSDNVRVASVSLYHRAMGTTTYSTRSMVKTTGNRYSATLEGSLVAAPGLEYYLEASDGVSIVRHGRADSPYRVTVSDAPQVTAVSPNRGPAGGGTAVTVSGSNLKEGASVTFGGAVASNVTLVSDNQLTAVTPAHFPAVVDVAVINPGGASGSLLRAFTYESDTVPVSLPDASGDSGAIVEIPISLADVKELRSASVTVQFDSNVLTARGARKGALAPGFSIETNPGTPGQVRVSLASATSVSGSGVLAYLEFLVNGAPSTASALTLASVSLNDGAIPVTLDDGTFTVEDLLDVSGQVGYYQGSRPVPGVSLTLDGNQSFSGATDPNGSYTLSGLLPGNYVLTPSKSGDTEAITAYDASFILRADAGLLSLAGHQQLAADVDKSGEVTSMDASYVLEKSAQLIDVPFPGAGKVWEFDPPSRSYQPLATDITGQDFTAILIGDVSGNWGQADVQGAGARAQAKTVVATAKLGLARIWVRPAERITIPLDLTLNQAELYGADIALTFDSSAVSVVSVDAGEVASDFSMAVNTNHPGQIRIAMAGATPITASGELLALAFDITGDYGATSPLKIASAQLNESAIHTELQSGRLTVAIRGDADFDRSVDIADLVLVASNFNLPVPPGNEQADLDGDGIVNIFDLAEVGVNFGQHL